MERKEIKGKRGEKKKAYMCKEGKRKGGESS